MDKVRLHKKRNLYRLAVARSDISASLHACDLLLSEINKANPYDPYDPLRNPLYQPLVEAIVISYSRPFTRNKPYGALPAKWGKMGHVKLQEIHDDLIASRAKAVAHSDFEERKIMITPPGAKIGKTELRTGGLGIIVTKRIFTAVYIRDIKNLCQVLGGAINRVVEDLNKELHGDRLLPNEAFELNCENDD